MPNIALFIHIGNHLMFPLIRTYIDLTYQLGYPIDLYISYQLMSPVIRLIESLYPDVVLIHSLLGCDIGGYLLLIDEAIKRHRVYDYVLKLHTKNNPRWREELFNPICGSIDAIQSIIDIFEKDPHIGMIGSSRYKSPVDIYNGRLQADLCKHLGLTMAPSEQYYIAGTIFWIRWKTVIDFIERNHISLQAEYRKLEPGYLKNHKPTFTHSWERIFGVIVHNEQQEILGLPSQTDEHSLDVGFYKNYYEDLRRMSDKEAISHWNKHGQKEGRLCNHLQLKERSSTDTQAIFRTETNPMLSVAFLVSLPLDFRVSRLIKVFIQEQYDVDLYIDINMTTTLRRQAMIETIEKKQYPRIFDDFILGDITSQLIEHDLPFLRVNFYKGFLVTKSYRYIISTSVDTAIGSSCGNFLLDSLPHHNICYLPSLSDDIDILTSGILGNPSLIIVSSLSSQIKLLKYYNNVVYMPPTADMSIYKSLDTTRENAICVISDDIDSIMHWILNRLPSDLIIYVVGTIPTNSPPNVRSLGSLSPSQYNEIYNKCRLGLSMSIKRIHQQTINMITSGLPVIEDLNCRDIPNDVVMKIKCYPEMIMDTIIDMLKSPQKLESFSRNGITYMNNMLTRRDRVYNAITAL